MVSFKESFFSKEFFLLLAILILGTFLRAYKLQEWPISVAEINPITTALDMINGTLPLYTGLNNYQGPMNAYVMIPAVFLFGSNIFSSRFSVMIFSIFSIFLLYFFAKKYYGKNVALFSCFILAILPADILTSTEAWEIPIVSFFIILFLYAFAKFSETKNKYYLYLLGLISGLAMMTRLTFVFFLSSFLLTFKLNPFISFSEFKKNITIKNILITITFFLLGLSPFLYWNLVNNFLTVNYLINHVPITVNNVNLLDVKSNLINGYHSFFDFLDNGPELKKIEFAQKFDSIIFLLVFILFIILTLRLHLKKRYEQSRKNFYILSNFLLIAVFKSLITITSFRIEDFYMILPFYSMIVSWSLIYVINFFKRGKIILILFVIFIVSLSAINLFSHYDQLIQSKQNDPCNFVTANLLEYLKNNSNSTVVFDTSMYADFYEFSSKTKNSNVLAAHDLNSTHLYERWSRQRDLIKNQNNEYVFVSKLCLPFWAKDLNIYENFANFVSANNKTLVTEKIFDRDNQEIARVAKVV